jgi:hypothetical protein
MARRNDTGLGGAGVILGMWIWADSTVLQQPLVDPTYNFVIWTKSNNCLNFNIFTKSATRCTPV